MVTLVVCCLAPTAFFGLMGYLYKVVVYGLPEWLRRPPPPPPKPDLNRLKADLRRLDAEFRCTERSGQPVRATRMRAVSMAYDDTLCLACSALGIPSPGAPMHSITRLQTEAALAERGLSW